MIGGKENDAMMARAGLRASERLNGHAFVRFTCPRKTWERIMASENEAGLFALPPGYDCGFGGRWTLRECREFPNLDRVGLMFEQRVTIRDNGRNYLVDQWVAFKVVP
jgi:hypothetical protein